MNEGKTFWFRGFQKGQSVRFRTHLDLPNEALGFDLTWMVAAPRLRKSLVQDGARTKNSETESVAAGLSGTAPTPASRRVIIGAAE
jgi:hypothetical protein